jgi:hypothetical protein
VRPRVVGQCRVVRLAFVPGAAYFVLVAANIAEWRGHRRSPVLALTGAHWRETRFCTTTLMSIIRMALRTCSLLLLSRFAFSRYRLLAEVIILAKHSLLRLCYTFLRFVLAGYPSSIQHRIGSGSAMPQGREPRA